MDVGLSGTVMVKVTGVGAADDRLIRSLALDRGETCEPRSLRHRRCGDRLHTITHRGVPRYQRPCTLRSAHDRSTAQLDGPTRRPSDFMRLDSVNGDCIHFPCGCDVRSALAGPLTGVRVLELGSFIAGPFAGQLLGDYGADVIKVEAPGDGDPMRRWGVTLDGDSLWWPAIGRNKRSVALDLRDAARPRAGRRPGGARATSCSRTSAPAGSSDGASATPSSRPRNPGLVLVHISGFGQTGPLAGQAGFGSVGEAMGGIRYTTGSPDRPPSRAGISLGDALASVFGVIGTLSALLSARSTGRRPGGRRRHLRGGRRADGVDDGRLRAGGVVRTRSGSVLPGVAPSNVYPTADGAEVVVAANADAVFARLCEAMGRPELADDERFATHGARGANMAELDELVAAWTRTLPCDEVLADPRRARRAGRAHLHRARHAHATRSTSLATWSGGSRRRRAGRCR